MKKLFCFIMTMVCLLVFSGCGQVQHDTSDNPGIQQQAVITEAVTEALTEAVTVTDIQTDSEDVIIAGDTGNPSDEPEETEEDPEQIPDETEEAVPDENGTYTSKDDVALFIHVYGRLPDNFISKKDAEKLGWSGGSLEPYAPGKCIGGSRFGNYEGILPDRDGRTYTECDIDTLGAQKRGAKRIVFSNDGLIYYTEDHYESFELLYGDGE